MTISSLPLGSILVVLIDFSLLMLLLSSFFKAQKRSWLYWILSVCTVAAISILTSSLFHSKLITYASSTLSIILICLFTYEKTVKTVLLSVAASFILVGIEFLYTNSVASQFTILPANISAQPSPIRLINILMSRLLLVSVILILRNRSILSSYSFLQVMSIIAYLCLTFISYVVIADILSTLSPIDDIIWICAILLCAGNSLCLSLFISIKKRDNKIREDALVIQRLESDYTRYTNINTHIEELEAWKHDIKKHLQSLLDIVKSSNDNKDEIISSYLSDIQHGLNQSSSFIDTKNPLFDSIISSYCIQAVNSGIDIDLEMIVPQLDFIDAVDLVSIVGNLWENAIEGCTYAHKERLDIPSIVFRTFVSSNHFVLELSNSCVSNASLSLLSSKNEPGHGIGTSVIRKLVDKYHGIYGYKVINSVYISRVAIPISSESYDKLDACIVFNWKTTNNDVSTHKSQE